MRSLRPTIIDDRGKRVPLVNHDWRAYLGGDAERMNRIKAAASVESWRPSAQELRRVAMFCLFMLPAILVGALAPAFITSRTWLPRWAQFLVILSTAVLPALISVFVVRRVLAQRIARSHVRAGLCASCGYDIRSIPGDAEGCRVCPECGAAWMAVPDDRATGTPRS